jgi:peptidyl-prolyl cis-trans isomerase SurA
MERLARDVGATQPVDIGTLKLGDLPDDLRATVASLPIGQASQPVRLTDGYIVLMVCDRSESTSGLPSREEVMRLLGSQRVEMMARRYMRDLRRVAFVDIRV